MLVRGGPLAQPHSWNPPFGHQSSSQLIWDSVHNQATKFQEFMSKAVEMIPFDHAHVVVKDTLQKAVDDTIPGDLILLSEGEHLPYRPRSLCNG